MMTGWFGRFQLICLVALFAMFVGNSRAELLAPQGTEQGAKSVARQATGVSGDSAKGAVQGDVHDRTRAGTVEFVEGDVRLIDDMKQPRRVQPGDPVFEKDSIVTGKDGELHLSMDDGGLIAVRPNTKMRIAQFRAQGDDDDAGIFGLLAGSFRSITGWIGKYNRQSYLIRTPTAAIGVRGTDHEPLVIPPNSEEGEPGTYDKVNAGESYIRTPHGSVDIAAGKSAFAPHAPKPGQEAPRLLKEVPHFYRPTRNESRIEKRHEEIQQRLDHLREDRRKHVADHRPLGQHSDKPKTRKTLQDERQSETKKRQASLAEQKQRQTDARKAQAKDRREARQEKKQAKPKAEPPSKPKEAKRTRQNHMKKEE